MVADPKSVSSEVCGFQFRKERKFKGGGAVMLNVVF
jgi:hypothetical protein